MDDAWKGWEVMYEWKGEEDATVIVFFLCVCVIVCKGYTWVRTTSLIIGHGGFATVLVR
jgi:hypothetical protein